MIKLRIKNRNCKNCKTRFLQERLNQSVCSVECSLELVKQAQEKKRLKADRDDRKETKVRLERLKTRSEYIKDAQVVFNKYIRERDIANGHHCICCNRTFNDIVQGGSIDAGHYRSVGSAPHLRFDEDNVHAQSKYCNNYLAGNHVNYRMGLIQRIGITRVERLELDNKEKKYTIDELKVIITEYRAKTRQILANRVK